MFLPLLLLGVQHAEMLPWAIRNHLTLGTGSFLSSAGGIDLFMGNNPQASGGWMAWRPVLEEREPAARDPDLGCFALDALARRAALDWIRDNPAAALRLYLLKLGHILGREGFLVHLALTGTNLWPPPDGASALPPGHFALSIAPAIQTLLDWSWRLLLALAAVGFVTVCSRLLRKKPGISGAALLLLPAAAYFPLIAAAFHSSSRYRWPAEELLVVLAAHAISTLRGRSLRPAVEPSEERPPHSRSAADTSGRGLV